ncbi:MAG: LemA family protein [Candidatus Bipolaricaulota bacterium]|nr:LemA family protein [Candidatus Bipolaricaulota bacterium]
MSTSVIIILAALAVVLLWAMAVYNRFVRLRVRAEESWRDIDTQLKRRWDLIPNLVEIVKGYAAHESGVFERVTEARAHAQAAITPKEQEAAEAQLRGAMVNLFAVAEAYPQLKANENFLQLQSSLGEVEDSIQKSRRYYNAIVRDFNTAIQVFPGSLVAGIFGFKPREFFALEDEAQREAPKVKF